MPTRAYFSRHISKKSMTDSDVNEILRDIQLFNQIKWTATNMSGVQDKSDRKAKSTSGIDLRKKEFAEQRAAQPESDHVKLKRQFGANDYFVNSAVNAAKGSIQSAKELKFLHQDEVSAQIKDLKQKIKETDKELKRINKIKKMLIRASKSRQPKYKLDGIHESYHPNDGTFRVLSTNYKGETHTVHVYDNPYLFELKYVSPMMKMFKARSRSLNERLERLNQKYEGLKDQKIRICYGSRKLFHQQDGMVRECHRVHKYQNHSVWRQAWHNARVNSLMISGRKDAKQGNFVFRYDTETHELSYQSQSGAAVIIPNVEFPYGQKEVEKAVNQTRDKQRAVTWRITETGGSFLIQCIVTIASDVNIMGDYTNGCIGMDANCDNLSISECDGSGNILRHKVIRLDLENKSSGEAEQVLSSALDEVFHWCNSAGKPLAMENLDVKHPANRYSGKRRNAVTSKFAFSKITQLAESKAYRHRLGVRKVNPAYTSQQGKILFVKKYGLSIHEAASAVIARRAMGIKEKLPRSLYNQLSDKQKQENRFYQWKALYSTTKKLRASQMYKYDFA